MIGRRAERRKYIKRIAIGSTIAAAAGYVAGLLTAPQSGKDTRGDIKDAASKGMAEAEKELKKLHTELDKAINEAKATSAKAGSKAKQELKELVAKAKDAKDKSREVLSAIHEGEAVDQDLNKAIKQAKNAAKNLRDYLKK